MFQKVKNSTEPVWDDRFALFPTSNDAIIFEIYNAGYVSSGQLATLRLPINSLQLEYQKDFEFWIKMDLPNSKVVTLSNNKPEFICIECLMEVQQTIKFTNIKDCLWHKILRQIPAAYDRFCREADRQRFIIANTQ